MTYSSENYFSIVMPPPNVTGSLHMGHALNNTIQDILIRWKKMNGYSVCWFPGTDHAGIATQIIVEKELKKEGKTRYDLGREKFIERILEWKKQYGGIIEEQLKKLGISCDWSRNAFTMDEKRSAAVQEAFFRLYKKGLIYRSKRMVNWCVRCLTALSDLEVEHIDSEVSTMYFLRYPIMSEKESLAVIIATTRPETILGDVAVAVHPQDSRYKHLIGKELILPLVGRRLKIIADELANPEVGTGAVKITPAHDLNDFEVGERHGLEQIVVIGLNGKMTTEYDKYNGLDRFTCREEILKDLKEQGYFVKEESCGTSPGRCSRCGTIIEPYLSVQWFMKMKELAEPAVEAVKQGKVKFHPDRFSKIYLDWMENIKDWCISRQLWWGHRIPAWYCRNENCPRGKKSQILMFRKLAQDEIKDPYQLASTAEPIIPEVKRENGKYKIEIPEKCPECQKANLTQDEDVLDTWFSSALWPLSTMGWPEDTKDLDCFYPTQVLSTGRDIINLWVARMIMMGLEFKQAPPFSDVYIHATILDREGKRMSKSKGTGINPLDLISKYGADATRFGIVLMAQGQDVRFNEEKIQRAGKFINKIFNAAKFVRNNIEDNFVCNLNKKIEIKEEKTKFYDAWVIFRLLETINKVQQALEQFNFSTAAFCIHDFFWYDFCDWYLELSKIALKENNIERKKTVQTILYYVLMSSLKLLYPFMPFLTEEIWKNFNNNESIVEKKINTINISEKIGSYNYNLSKMNLFIEVVKTIRALRLENKIPPNQKISVSFEIIKKINILMMKKELFHLCNISNLSIKSPQYIKSINFDLYNFSQGKICIFDIDK